MSVSICQQAANTMWTGCVRGVDTQETDTMTNTRNMRQDTPLSARAFICAGFFGSGEKEAQRCSIDWFNRQRATCSWSDSFQRMACNGRILFQKRKFLNAGNKTGKH
jgi:hypothetical protein